MSVIWNLFFYNLQIFKLNVKCIKYVIIRKMYCRYLSGDIPLVVWNALIYFVLHIYIYVKIYISFERHIDNGTDMQAERDLPSTASYSNCPVKLELGKVRARSSALLICHTTVARRQLLEHSVLSPSVCIPRRLECEHSLEWGTEGCRHPGGLLTNEPAAHRIVKYLHSSIQLVLDYSEKNLSQDLQSLWNE